MRSVLKAQHSPLLGKAHLPVAANQRKVSCRADEQVLRRIVVSEYLYPEKTYYLRFKNVLDAEYAECFMDYIEYCAKEVYDNPEESEDIW